MSADSTKVFVDSTAWTVDRTTPITVTPPVPDVPVPALVEEHIDRIATQYRESPRLLGLARAFLQQVEEARAVVAAIPTYFDLDTAVGHQLTLLGKRLGWPRCHCVCDMSPVFGFDCGTPDPNLRIVGFCEGGTWVTCREVGGGELCLWDDAVYRGYLRARRYQMLGLYDLVSLTTALRHVWGPTATVIESGQGRVVLASGRVLLAEELRQLPLAVRVMPIAPGIRATVHLGGGPIFGFGEGWAGLCEEPAAEFLCEVDPHAYDCQGQAAA